MIRALYSLLGEGPDGRFAPVPFTAVACPQVAYDLAVREANRLVASGAYRRIYIMTLSDYCCELGADGKPMMLKHHLGED